MVINILVYYSVQFIFGFVAEQLSVMVSCCQSVVISYLKTKICIEIELLVFLKEMISQILDVTLCFYTSDTLIRAKKCF